ncbi:hypothetical protein JG687_00016519 [Phytophthora cactorum]|uniref:Uncharacterized protein n=1 Tax=Phytophthora cactorum TaxID=29920 RepID=A0A8T1TUY9_9STRA|nr:hypothetical protein JG687_00016519 [Phytophthora cactorum]
MENESAECLSDAISAFKLNNTSRDLIKIDNSHWCGVVFDYRFEHRGVVLFDPLQATKSKYLRRIRSTTEESVWRNMHTHAYQEGHKLTLTGRLKLWCCDAYVFRVLLEQHCHASKAEPSCDNISNAVIHVEVPVVDLFLM